MQDTAKKKVHLAQNAFQCNAMIARNKQTMEGLVKECDFKAKGPNNSKATRASEWLQKIQDLII